MVRDIIALRGDHHRRSSMEFLVQWTGYVASFNSWKPYKALMHVDKLHEYIEQYEDHLSLSQPGYINDLLAKYPPEKKFEPPLSELMTH